MHFGTAAFILCFLICGANTTPAQTTGDKPDRNAIDRMNDHAWTVAKIYPDSAIYYAEEAIRLSTQADKYPKGLMNAHMILGIVNKDRGYYGISTEHYLSAMTLADAEGDSLRVSGCLNNIGSVHQEQGNYLKALDYFKQSLEIEKTSGKDKEQLSIRLYNIGDAYQKLDSLERAYAYFYQSLLIEEDLNNKEGIFYARLGIGNVDAKTGNESKALTELNQALALATELKNHYGTCEAHLALGNLFLKQKKFADSRHEFEAALDIAVEKKYTGLMKDGLGGLTLVHAGKGDFAAAYHTQQQYYQLREELNSTTVNGKIGELQLRYEVARKDREIATLNQKESLRLNELTYERKLRNYLFVTVGLVLILVGYNIVRARQGAASE